MTRLGAKRKRVRDTWAILARDSKPPATRDPLAGFETVEEAHGWRFGLTTTYPDTVVIACPCGHLSTRDRDEVPDHVCPACGRTVQR